MTDPTAPELDNDSGPRWTLIVVSVLVVVGAAIAAFAFFGSDDDDASTTSDPTDTTPAPTTTTAGEPTTAPTTEAPATTSAPTTATPTTEPDATLEFTIENIDDGGRIPIEFTCDGDNTPVVVTVESSPAGTLELAFVVDDPDAPTDEPFVHWVVYSIPGDATEFTDAEDGITYGVNDADVEGWVGPCPPDGEHEYVFTMFALDQTLELDAGLDGRELVEMIADATIAEVAITATYERAG